MGGAGEKHIKAVASVFHPFCRVRRGPVCFRLAGQRCPNQGYGISKILEELFPWMPDRITEFERAVTHVSGTGNLSSNVIIQVSGEVEQQVADAVAVRIRACPDLMERERLHEVNDCVSPFLVIAAEIAGDGCRCVCHEIHLRIVRSMDKYNINAMRTLRQFKT